MRSDYFCRKIKIGLAIVLAFAVMAGMFTYTEAFVHAQESVQTVTPTDGTQKYLEVTFVDGDSVLVKQVAAGEKVTSCDGALKDSVSQNIVFEGWVRSTDGALVSTADIAEYAVFENMTYTARYLYITKKFTVRFVSADFDEASGAGTIYQTTEVEYNGLVIPPAEPVMEGTDGSDYVFNGWKCLENGAVYPSMEDVHITSNMTLQAVFEATGNAPTKKKPVKPNDNDDDDDDDDVESSTSSSTASTATGAAVPGITTIPAAVTAQTAAETVRVRNTGSRAAASGIQRAEVLGDIESPETTTEPEKTIQITEDEKPKAEETELTQVSENEVPLSGFMEEDTVSYTGYWIILLLLFAAITCMIVYFVKKRKKQND